MKKKNHRALHQSNKNSKPILYIIWRTALPVLATILGVFIGPFLEQVVPPFFDPKNLPFVKIVQIPDGHKLEEVFPSDPFYQDDCKFIVELNKDGPKFANLRVSEIFFQNTFCIIDRSFLYLEFDIRSFMKKKCQAICGAC